MASEIIWFGIFRKDYEMKETRHGSKLIDKLNKAVVFLDGFPLWWVGLVVLVVTFLPYFVLREGSVFEIHDQMDETLLTYVLNARHMGDGSAYFPEMLGGINASGMQPSAVLFIPLYRFLPVFVAFLVQYAVVCASGFFGMYFSVKRITSSSILATAMAGCFCLLPIQPVYGLSVLGVPLLLYAFLCLYDRKNLIVSFLLILFFGLTTHLVLIGYVVLGFWALYICYVLIKKKHNIYVYLGFALLTAVYVIVNKNLFLELLLGNSSYISHREELVNYGMPFWNTTKQVFLESAQHAPSLHKYLILPIVALLILGGIGFREKDKGEKIIYVAAATGFAVLVAVAILYGICKSPWITEWKNSMSGFLRYFQIERFYWIYPAGWYLEFALCFRIWWGGQAEEAQQLKNIKTGREDDRKMDGSAKWHLYIPQTVKLLVLIIVLYPTINLIKVNSYFYMNVNQINNGSGITGYITWENYYAEELMQQIDEAIGKDKTTYRVAHLGVSPAPSLMHGFYTVDGYSNNYPLEYKHRFRQIIAEELAQNEEMCLYFDEWGSRCYLFNATTGTYWNLAKNTGVQYQNLTFDLNALKALGCEYLFSGGEITNAEEIGLKFKGYYATENSHWGIWLYELQ